MRQAVSGQERKGSEEDEEGRADLNRPAFLCVDGQPLNLWRRPSVLESRRPVASAPDSSGPGSAAYGCPGP